MTDNFKIETGLPIPTAPTGRKLKYPWPEMCVGDSVLIPLNGVQATSIRNSAWSWLQKHRPDMKASLRLEGSGVRVWFVAKDPA